MKLATRFVAFLAIGVLILIGVDGFLALRRDMAAAEAKSKREAEELRDELNPLVNDSWQRGGEERVMQLIEEVNAARQSVRIRWVWLDAPPQDPNSPLAERSLLNPIQAGELVSFRHVDQSGKEHFVSYAQVAVGGARNAALEFVEPTTYKNDMVREFVWRMITMTSLTLLFAVGLVVFLGAELVGRPLRMLLDKVRRVGHGDLAGPVQWKHGDEFSELADAINSMCDDLGAAREKAEQEEMLRISAMDQLRHGDRLRTVGRLAAGIAHELGTPLNVVGGRAAMIAAGSLPEDETKKSAEIIKKEADRITAIIRQLLDFARRNPPKRVATDMQTVADRAVDLLSGLAEKRGIKLTRKQTGPEVRCEVDAGQIQQVLINLIVNAEQAMPDGGSIEVDVRVETATPPEGVDAKPGEFVAIAIHDEGTGIAEEDLPHLFEPFFTTKDVGDGTGLGLSIAFGIVQEHGGWVDVASQVGEGSCFTVYLPRETTI